jgi:hypothetical protein
MAEVRAIAYLTGEDFFINCYETKQDPYLQFSRKVDPTLSEEAHMARRTPYKMTLLGI